MSWKIHISDSSHFICDAWDSDLPPSESFERQLHFLIHSKDKIESERQKDLQAKVAIRPNNDLCNDYDNFKLREKVFEHAYSKKLVISVRHAILNKTDIPLEFGVEGEFIIPLDAHSSCLFNIPAGTKLSFRARGFGISPPPDFYIRLVEADAGHDRRSNRGVFFTANTDTIFSSRGREGICWD